MPKQAAAWEVFGLRLIGLDAKSLHYRPWQRALRATPAAAKDERLLKKLEESLDGVVCPCTSQ
jgi:hypothetical protein